MKEKLAEIIQCLLENEWDEISWREYVIDHYKDETIENVRRELVRISIDDPAVTNNNEIISMETENKLKSLLGVISDPAT